MREQYNEEELKRIILWIEDAPDFGAQYDALTNRPFTRRSENVDEWTMIATLQRTQERIAELEARAEVQNVQFYPNYNSWTSLTITYQEIIDRDTYINDQLRLWRQSSPANNYKSYLFRTLWLRNQSSIRNIFVKLLLEHKITLDDFKDLVDSRDIEVNLVGICGWDAATLTANQNYFI